MRRDAPSHRRSPKWKWIAAAAAVVVLIAAWHFLPLQDWVKALERQVNGLGVLGGILYAAIFVVGSLLFVPGSILGLGAGYLFGFAGGMAVAWAAATVTAAIGFLIARYLARHPVERAARRNPRFAAIDAAIARSGWKMVCLLRLAAIVPFSLSNYLFGLSSVDFVTYMATSAVATLPGIFFYVYLGAAGRSLAENGPRSPWEWAVLAAGIAASVVMTVVITRIAKRHLRSGRADASGFADAGLAEPPTSPRLAR